MHLGALAMKIRGLSAHSFAPELNTLHWENGAVTRAPGITSLAQYRAKIRKPAPRIIATVKTHYPEPLKWLERSLTGRVGTRQEALAFARAHVACRLAPTGSYSVKTRLVY